jgi:hypothetical protein
LPRHRNPIQKQLSLDDLFAFAQFKKQVVSLPKFPGISRDISILLKEEVSPQEILKAIYDLLRETYGPFFPTTKAKREAFLETPKIS